MNADEKPTLLNKLLERLHDPVQLRVFITGVMLLVGYMAIYSPLSTRIDETKQKLRKGREHQSLKDDTDQLKAEVDRFAARLPKDTDINEWVQYVLAGVRKLPVTLANLDSDEPRRIGRYEAVVLRVELRGEYRNLDLFLDWVESNERLFRVDSVSIAPARGNNGLEMRVTLLGLRG